jgi:hypothetical protein
MSGPRLGWNAVVLGAGLALWPGGLFGANATTPGALSFPNPTLENISVLWLIDGDDDNDGIVTVRYRETGETSWRTGMPLRRVPCRDESDQRVDVAQQTCG